MMRGTNLSSTGSSKSRTKMCGLGQRSASMAAANSLVFMEPCSGSSTTLRSNSNTCAWILVTSGEHNTYVNIKQQNF